jgi:hypothetical protein
MASIINTNISSLTAQRNLGVSQAALATSMARLSSGLRINSAKDDAAGLAISERMTAQVRGVSQAARASSRPAPACSGHHAGANAAAVLARAWRARAEHLRTAGSRLT